MPRTPPPGPHGIVKIGDKEYPVFLNEATIKWMLEGEYDTEVNIGSINSGVAQLEASTAAQLQAERDARINNDAALQGGIAGGGTNPSNSAVFSGIVSSGATWVVACTVTLTPGGAGGDYTITAYPDISISGHLSVENPAGATFNGNWQIIEEETIGGTEYVLAMGTFTVTYTPRQIEGGEGGGSFIIPESWAVDFFGLPTGPLAANNSAQSDIRLEIQRASGTNEITAPGLSGSVAVTWTA